MTDDPPLTVEDLARRWGCSTRFVRDLWASGELVSFRIGRRRLTRLSDVLDYEGRKAAGRAAPERRRVARAVARARVAPGARPPLPEDWRS